MTVELRALAGFGVGTELHCPIALRSVTLPFVIGLVLCTAGCSPGSGGTSRPGTSGSGGHSTSAGDSGSGGANTVGGAGSVGQAGTFTNGGGMSAAGGLTEAGGEAGSSFAGTSGASGD